MSLSDNLSLDAMAYKGGTMSFWRYQLPKRQFKAGEELRTTMLFVKGAWPEQANNALAEAIRTKMGMAGKPAYTLDVHRGETPSTIYRIQAQAQGGAWAATIGKAALPVLLPIEVSGCQDHWEAFCYTKNDKVMRPAPVTDGTCYVSLDIANGADVVIGHPVVCDKLEVKLVVLQTGDAWSVVAHNPIDKALEVTLTGNGEFPGMAGLKKTVTVPAGASLIVPIP